MKCSIYVRGGASISLDHSSTRGAMCGNTRQTQREFFFFVSSLKATTAARNNQRPHDSLLSGLPWGPNYAKLCYEWGTYCLYVCLSHGCLVCLSVCHVFRCLLSALAEPSLHSNDFNEIFNSQQREFIVLGLKLCTLRQLHVVWPLKNKHPTRVESRRVNSRRVELLEVL